VLLLGLSESSGDAPSGRKGHIGAIIYPIDTQGVDGGLVNLYRPIQGIILRRKGRGRDGTCPILKRER